MHSRVPGTQTPSPWVWQRHLHPGLRQTLGPSSPCPTPTIIKAWNRKSTQDDKKIMLLSENLHPGGFLLSPQCLSSMSLPSTLSQQ